MKNAVGVILFFFICLFLYIKLAGPIPFTVNSIQTTKTDVFQVTGKGSASAVPDTATVSFGVTKQASTVTDAQNQTNTAVSAILNSLKQLGISTQDIQTTDYSVSPNYDYTSANQTITSYTVSQNMTIKIQPIDKTNKVLDTVTSSGANLVGQVSFVFSDQKEQQLEDQARQSAVADAKTKAQSLANAAGVHLGPIINIQENPSNPSPIVLPLGIAAAQNTSAQQLTQVTPGTNSIDTTITLSYSIF